MICAGKDCLQKVNGNNMLIKIKDYIHKNHMIDQGDRIVVGVSGGADSVCLLHALLMLREMLKIELVVVHINHGLRGEEAAEDESFVSGLCSRYQLPFFTYHYDVRKIAGEKGITEEEAGREVRYNAFLQVGKEQACNKIAVAHNKNDNAETVLFHLFRGSGLRGLSGIEPRRKLSSAYGVFTLIRPLMCIERYDIEEYLSANKLDYRVDSSNLTMDYSRNKIRNGILPFVVDQLNAGAIGNINEAAGRIKEALDYMDISIHNQYLQLIKKADYGYSIAVKPLTQEPVVIQKGLIRRVLENLSGSLKDLEAKHVEAVLSLCYKQVGRIVKLPNDIIVEKEYNDIKFMYGKDYARECFTEDHMEPVQITVPGRYIIPGNRRILETKLLKYEKNEPIPKNSCVKWFDYDKIENTVEMRNRKEGDYIQINASGGRKKLKDYFIDHKLPRKQRDSQILITDGSHVMWIPGFGDRISEKYKVEDTTSKVLLMKLIDLEEMEDDR